MVLEKGTSYGPEAHQWEEFGSPGILYYHLGIRPFKLKTPLESNPLKYRVLARGSTVSELLVNLVSWRSSRSGQFRTSVKIAAGFMFAPHTIQVAVNQVHRDRTDKASVTSLARHFKEMCVHTYVYIYIYVDREREKERDVYMCMCIYIYIHYIYIYIYI